MIRRPFTNAIIVHCSATPPTMDIGAKEIREWHVRDSNWRDIGYNAVIRRNGVVEPGRPLWAQGAHVSGHNHRSVGVCLVGGVGANGNPVANYTPEQWGALGGLVRWLCDVYPGAEVLGHRDLDAGKLCPVFDVRAWWAAVSAATDVVEMLEP